MKKYLLAPPFAVALVIFAGIFIAVFRMVWAKLGLFPIGPTGTFFTSGFMVLGIGFFAAHVASQRLPDGGHKRGTIIADGTEAQKLAVNLKRKHRDVLTLAGVPVAPEDETKHFKLIGTTGTGKSTAIRE